MVQDLMLPGLDLVPPNTVVPLETNTPFVEAYLVGLNTEMGRELLWRAYPADPTATYFDRFWNADTAPGRPPDIEPLATWANRVLGAAESQGEQFVMLVRSELLRELLGGHIAADSVHLALRGTESRHDGIQRLHIGQHNFIAALRQQCGGDQTDALRGSGNDCNIHQLLRLRGYSTALSIGVYHAAESGPEEHVTHARNY